jgi:hypothetical protein
VNALCQMTGCTGPASTAGGAATGRTGPDGNTRSDAEGCAGVTRLWLPQNYFCYRAACAAPAVPAAESTLGSHPCVALRSGITRVDRINLAVQRFFIERRLPP